MSSSSVAVLRRVRLVLNEDDGPFECAFFFSCPSVFSLSVFSFSCSLSFSFSFSLLAGEGSSEVVGSIALAESERVCWRREVGGTYLQERSRDAF